MEKTDIKSLSPEELKALAVSLGEKPFRGSSFTNGCIKNLLLIMRR